MRLDEEIDQLQDEYPNLRNFTAEQLREELLAIEADSYAEFVRTGQLNKELAPFLQGSFEQSKEPT
jgi:CPA1 family monovalent cation:H+ antiporter